MDWISLISIVLSLLLIGFFAGIEIAFISANKLTIELKKKQGSFSGKTWARYNENPAKFIGTMLVGINIVLVIYGILIGNLLLPVWGWIKNAAGADASPYVDLFRIIVETVLSTCILLFIEFLTKTFFRARSNKIIASNFVSYLTSFFYTLLSSIAGFFVNIAEWILQYIFNVKIRRKKESFSKIDLEHFFSHTAQAEEEESSDINKELFENALSLTETKIRNCLIPRKEIEALDSSCSMDMVKAKFVETKLSRIIIYENNIDNIIGYVHHLDLFKHPTVLKDIIHPIPTVPETMTATDLMTKFSKERKSIAWVVDEFGGTAGIVSMEDLLEELFGEIEDEHDVPETLVHTKLSDNEFILSGRLELDFINEKYGLEFQRNETTETLSGFIIEQHESIPKVKDRVIVGDYEFEMLTVSDTRIETVKLKVLH